MVETQQISEQFALEIFDSYSRSEDVKCLNNNQDIHLQRGELWKFAEHISQLPTQLIICNVPTKVINSKFLTSVYQNLKEIYKVIATIFFRAKMQKITF